MTTHTQSAEHLNLFGSGNKQEPLHLGGGGICKPAIKLRMPSEALITTRGERKRGGGADRKHLRHIIRKYEMPSGALITPRGE